MQDHVLNPLRKSLTPEGTVAPKALAQWKMDYAPALKALDAKTPGFSKQFDNAAAATDYMLKAGALREQALKQFQTSAAAKFLGKSSPSEVEAEMLGILRDKKNGVSRMQSLVKTVGNDPDALEGARRAGIDAMIKAHSNMSEAGTSGLKVLSPKLNDFVTQNRAALQALYPEQQVNQLAAIGRLRAQMELSTTAAANRGTSQTSRDQASTLKKLAAGASKHSGKEALMAIIGDHILEHGFSSHSLMLAGGAAATVALSKLRAHNASADHAMIQDAMLNPERFAHYVSRVSPLDAESRGRAVARSIRRQLINQTIATRATAH